MKFSMIIDSGDGQGRSLRRRRVKTFSVERIINVVQTRAGRYRVAYVSAVAEIETYNMIATGHEQKASRVVQGQPLQLVTADAPLSDHFVGPRIDGHRVSGLFDVCVESSLPIVDAVTFPRSIQRNFRFQFHIPRLGSSKPLDAF